MNIQAPFSIGVFDSGIGGLSVLREVRAAFPSEHFLYLADTKHLPYGEKTESQIKFYVKTILDWFNTQKVKLVIIACHTSSAIAHSSVENAYTFPVLCSISPIAKALKNKSKRIGIMATRRTTESKVFELYLKRHNPDHQIFSVSCPEFVPLIESQKIDTQEAKNCLQRYLSPLLKADIDSLIFGCTHYPFLKDAFMKLLPTNRQLTFEDPARYITQNLTSFLPQDPQNATGTIRFFTTSPSETFQQQIDYFMGIKSFPETLTLF